MEENPLALPIGFAVKNDTLSYKPSKEIDPPSNVNSMASLMTGSDAEIMKDVTGQVTYENYYCTVKESVSKKNSVLISPNTSEDATFVMEYVTEEGGQYYLYLAATDTKSVSVILDGQLYLEGKIINGWLALPELDKGVIIDIYFETDNESSLVWYFSRFDGETTDAVLRLLSENSLDVTSCSEGTLDARADIREDEMLVTTIPYDKGWKVYDNGEIVETVPVLRGFTGISLI